MKTHLKHFKIEINNKTMKLFETKIFSYFYTIDTFKSPPNIKFDL